MDEAPDTRGTVHALVGRDREMARVASALDAARSGHGGLILIRGAPGSGRTRLAREAADAARRRGMEVVWQSCADAACDDVMESAVSRTTTASPFVLVLDDLHVAGEAMLAQLLGATPLLSERPVVVLATVVDPAPPDARRAVAALEPEATCLTMDALSIDAIVELAEHAGIEAPPRVLERLHVLTAGNALLVVESLDALTEYGSPLAAEPWPLPSRAVDWMRRRLATLTPPRRAALEAASVLGPECAVATVAQMLDDAADLSSTRRALDESCMLVALDGSGRHRFAPPMAGDLVQASLSDGRRAALHARAAVVLGDADASDAAALVHRCLAATIAGDARRAEVHLRHLAALAGAGRTIAAPAPGEPGRSYLANEGEYWIIDFGGLAVRVRERAGLLYLAQLLESPGIEVPALVLARRGPRDAALVAEHTRELAAERARVSVTRRIRDTIDRIAQVHPELGAHLTRTIRTGARCSYQVDSGTGVHWEVRWSG